MLSEFSIIEKFFEPLTNGVKAAQNLKDDVAKISLKEDEELLISKDLIVEDVHFLRKDGADKIAAKLLLSNLSDIASTGAKPVYYMLGFSKNSNVDEKFVEDFCLSLKEIQDEYKISLIGGDTVKSIDKLFFSVTIFGIIKKNQNLSRKNAEDNDLIFVSGLIGAAHLGLSLKMKDKKISELKLEKNEKDAFLDKHFFPKPRINLGIELVKQKLSKCAIDISDGLLADLNHICTSSKMDAIIYQEKIPLASDKANFLDLVSGGEDYELIFTAKKSNKNKILQLAKKLKITLTCIGFLQKTNKNPKIKILNKNNKEINFKKYGYEH